MMTITCEKCKREYKGSVKCRNCGNLIQVTNQPLGREADESLADKKGISGRSVKRAELSDQIHWKDRIQTLISFILILLTSLILLGFVFYNYFVTKAKANDELNQSVKIIATRLSKNLVGPLWGLEEAQIEDSLNSEMMQKNIYGILIFDRDTAGISMGKKRDDKNWNAVPTTDKITGHFISQQANIIRNNQTIGRVEVYATMKFMNEELNWSIFNIVITAVILNIAIFIVVFIALRKIIVQPIIALTAAAESMSMGDLNAVIDVGSKNEVGLLAQAIERMRASLQLALERIRKK